MSAFAVSCAAPFLVAEFAAPQSMVSWSLTRPGFVTARKVVWLGVRDDDLSLGVDPAALLETKMAAAGHADAVQLMTSRDVGRHHLATASSGTVTSTCLATVGLSNATRVGMPPLPAKPAGTINLLAHVDRPLGEAALIEAVSIATQARTAAVMDANWRPRGTAVTGTGTDCIVIAAPARPRGEAFAGLHTDIGAAIGRAVYDAVSQGCVAWIDEKRQVATTA
jgi:adenosylcobinamide amidohydrolase